MPLLCWKNKQINKCCLCIQNPKLVLLKWSPAGEILPYPSPCYNLLYLANHLSLDSSIGFRRTYPVDSDFSVRLAHWYLEQLEPELCGTSETKGTLIPPSDYLQFLPFFSLLPPFHQLTFLKYLACVLPSVGPGKVLQCWYMSLRNRHSFILFSLLWLGCQ